ncbi:MAG: hypothetical protein AABN33_16895 [Acidobacteriota bacterium]
MQNETWSKGEQAIARRAFDQASARECSALADEVRRRAKSIAEPSDIWKLHDFLTRERRAIDEKYDYRYSVLIFVFTRLIRDGWLTEAEIAGLSEDRLAKIRFLVEEL